MFHAKRTLAVKITSMLVIFFLVALTAIGLTLFVSHGNSKVPRRF